MSEIPRKEAYPTRDTAAWVRLVTGWDLRNMEQRVHHLGSLGRGSSDSGATLRSSLHSILSLWLSLHCLLYHCNPQISNTMAYTTPVRSRERYSLQSTCLKEVNGFYGSQNNTLTLREDGGRERRLFPKAMRLSSKMNRSSWIYRLPQERM